jgi:predicted Zn finger-like uncharacterized protein
MKIVCDNCATKYSIADEKVRGKVFKIRCKKCSHIIVVRGNENGAEANGAAAGGNGAGDAFAEESLSGVGAASTGGGAANADSVWHLVIDREQVGPMTAAEVRAKFAAGEIDVETYAWREGFGDWLRLGSIDEFRDLEAKAPAAAPSDEGATRRTDAADLFARAAADEAESNQDAGADLFGAAGASPAAKPAAADVFAPTPAANPFAGGGEAAPRSARASAPKLNPVGSDLDGGGAGAATASSEPRMAGQRNENSVLFSLNNLQALASGSTAKGASSAAKPGVDTRPGYANSQSEGSGLIDIRAMAASTLASTASTSSAAATKEEAPTFAAPPIFSPMAAPIMMPAAPTGTPKWVFAVLGVGVLAVVGIIVVGVLLLTRKPEAPPIVAVAPPTTPAPVAAPTTPTPAAPTTPAPTAAPTTPTAAPAGEAKSEAKAEPAAGSEKKSSKKDKKEKSSASAKSDAPGGLVPPPTESPKAAPAPSAPAKKRDAIDDLLDGASPDKGSKKPAAAAAEKSSSGGGEDLPDQLDKAAIVGGMSKVKGKVAACYDQYKVPGMANVAVTIAKSGTVSSASVSGAFAGTPTGACVEKAVKSATFPKFKGAAQSINYPFILR